MKINKLYRPDGIAHLLWLGVWAPLSLILAFTPLLLLNLLQFPSLLLLPFSKGWFRAYNRRFAAMVWGWWAWASQKIVGLEVRTYGDDIKPDENAVIIANHQSMSDILIILCLALGKGRIGDIKWLVKDVLKWVPGLGWGMLFIECVFVKRDWQRDQDKLTNAVQKFSRQHIPVWLILFPEGSRFTTAKRTKSQEYGRKFHTFVFDHVLYPRTKGFQAVIQGMRGNIGAVYSLTIGYEGWQVPSLTALIRGDVPRVHCHIRRTAIADFPQENGDVDEWLIEDFKQKEQRLGPFSGSQSF